MPELRIWTVRHTTRIAMSPRNVFELVANVDRWRALLDSLVSVEHLGFDGVCERVRFSKRVNGVTQGMNMMLELNPKRMQVRFRHVDVLPPLASMGGLWLVLPKGRSSSMVALDHYYRVTDNSPVTAARVEAQIAEESTSMLTALRDTADFLGMADLVGSY